MEPVMPQSNFFSLKSFAELVYQDYIRGPLIGPRLNPITENRKENHTRILTFLKERDKETYQKALEILILIQELAEDPEEAKKFEEYRNADGKRLSVLEALSLPEEPQQEEGKRDEEQPKTVQQGETTKSIPQSIQILNFERQPQEKQGEEISEQSNTYAQDFSQLEDEDLIGTRLLDSLTITLLRQKYGERIKMVEGKSEYYLNDLSETEDVLINDLGERIVIRPKGKLSYYDPVGVREYVSCYEIIKEKMGSRVAQEVFTNIRMPELSDPEYARAVAEFLLSDENLSLYNYGGYIGEIEKAAVAQKNTRPIPPEQVSEWDLPRQSKYCIYYDPMALTAAKLFERQKEKEKERPADGLSEFEPDASGR